MIWIIFRFHPLSKQWGAQPSLPPLPGSPGAVVRSRVNVSCDSSPIMTIPITFPHIFPHAQQFNFEGDSWVAREYLPTSPLLIPIDWTRKCSWFRLGSAFPSSQSTQLIWAWCAWCASLSGVSSMTTKAFEMPPQSYAAALLALLLG